jgi:glycosyltransferase involved in cell wall biosynthesis
MPSWEVERGDRETLRGVEQRALRAADAAIVTSLLTAERLRAEAPALPIATVTPGADRWPRPEPVKGSGLRLLSVGSLVPRKRLDLVLDALEQVADGRVSLTVAGDPGRDPAYARAIAARVGASPLLGDRVALRGVIPDESLARAMSRADALVLASSLEGYGMVVAEALHAGVPVLVSRAAAGAAGVVDGAGARVFDDAPSLAAIVAHLARDSVARAALRRSARSWVAPRWADSVAAFRAALVARVSGRGA